MNLTTFSIQSFGCRVNQSEAFFWTDELQKRGLRFERNVLHGDIVLVNTCTLTSRADRDVRGFIRKIRRENPKARLVITGCYVEQPREELGDLPQVWRVLPNREKSGLIDEVLSGVHLSPVEEVRPYRSRAMIKVQDGCQLGCTFCVVPKVRGESVSRTKEEILGRIRQHENEGFCEIVLTGIHLCLYGMDSEPKSSLLDLLGEIEKQDGPAWIRLSSLDPRFLDGALLEHLTRSARICPHFHLSLQHGADSVLRRMGRKVSAAHYARVLTTFRKFSPEASLGADIIVGFPGETGEEFDDLYKFLQESPLNYFHVFSYSPRPGTPAAAWPQVDAKVRKERSQSLRDLSREKNREFRRRFVGRTMEAVLVKKEENRCQALTPNYLRVLLPSASPKERERVRLRITGLRGQAVQGEVESPE